MNKWIKWIMCVMLVVVSGVVGSDYVNATDASSYAVLVLGIDSEDDGGAMPAGRSDVMMVATVDPAQHQVKLISIPRDSYVEISGQQKQDKINHAYAFGGVETAKKTVEQLLGIPIQYYVVVDMKDIEHIVDAVGGIDVVPPATFSILGYTFYEGESTHLTGEAAVAYARERNQSGGDYARQERQRQLVDEMMKQLMSSPQTLNIPELLTALGNKLKTNVNVVTAMGLFNQLRTAPITFDKVQLSGEGMTIDEVYYIQLDAQQLKDVKEQIKTIGKKIQS